MLRITNVTVRFGEFEALANVSLSLGAAERLAVLGPSGSGKSTLLRAIAGLEPLAAGSVEWDGRDLGGVPAHRREFGLMFQDYALFPHLDVRANVAFGLRMQGLPEFVVAGRVAQKLELVGLAGYEARGVAQLSGGEQQRVALARALAPEPRLLMLDEPLGALDRGLREELLTELIDLFATLHLPLIYVTHDQHEALAVGERVAVMRSGRLETVMPAHELWHSPPTEFVARFLGHNNVAEFTIADGRLATPWGDLPMLSQPPPGARQLLIRADGLQLDPAGTITGTIETVTFRGDHTALVVRTRPAAPPLEVELRGPTTVVPGDSITLGVAPDAVQLLGPEAIR